MKKYIYVLLLCIIVIIRDKYNEIMIIIKKNFAFIQMHGTVLMAVYCLF